MDLFFLDETGFALTQPPTHTWCRRRQRPFVPYAYRQRPRVGGLDNASIHRSTTIREARETLAQQHRIHLWYLPPYSPERNDIERTFRQAKHEGMPRRTQPHTRALLAAVHACFQNLQDKLLP